MYDVVTDYLRESNGFEEPTGFYVASNPDGRKVFTESASNLAARKLSENDNIFFDFDECAVVQAIGVFEGDTVSYYQDLTLSGGEVFVDETTSLEFRVGDMLAKH